MEPNSGERRDITIITASNRKERQVLAQFHSFQPFQLFQPSRPKKSPDVSVGLLVNSLFFVSFVRLIVMRLFSVNIVLAR
jgi:hypothetical protein